MSKEVKTSTKVIGGIITAATVTVGATTASAVLGGSAATIMTVTAGTVGA